ncbi:MAG: ABC transporter ATP-binding protein [Cyanobium sp. LacPavin_0920_WC12_MAG_63_22]|nr:ABC transporter ATP-binding protein [Cyanobium sp. LacPavin_0920_WC12_MAG_63_22]
MSQSPFRKSSWPLLQSWQKFFSQQLPSLLMILGDDVVPTTRIIRQTVRAQKKLLALSMLLTLLLGVAEACILVVIFSLGRLISATGLNRETAFVTLLLMLLGLQVISSLCRYMSSTISGWISASCQARIIPIIHRYILSLSFACASGFKAGNLAHLAGLAPIAINIEIEEKSSLISNGILTLIYFIILTLISPWLILLVGLLGFSMAATQAWLRPKISSASMEVERRRQETTSAIMADIQILRLLHSNAAIRHAELAIEQSMAGLERSLKRLSYIRSLFEPIAEALPMLAAVLLGLLSWQLTGGRSELMIPSLATFVLALQRLNIRLIKIGQSSTKLIENSASLAALDELLEPDNKLFRRSGSGTFSGLQNQIEFRSVGLLYPGQEQPALVDVSFSVEKYASVALVGASGAGKSSLIDLLVGLMAPTSGAILVDGVDLQTLNTESWQRQLGVVSQDVLLIHDTVAANITFGIGAHATPADIRKAAEAACAAEFISQLPSGYATVIGEHGHFLSGGQRQRLSLARAILRQPEIIILDEATSALDSHLEARVHQAIQAFGSGRTVLAVAHRLSSIRDAELILVIDSGRVVERGNHHDLLTAGGAYAALWKRQQGKANPPI